MDREMEVRRDNGVLVALLAKHVDDIKIAGLRSVIKQIIEGIESVFGKLAYHENSFTNTGIRHRLTPDGVRIDQDDYIQALKTIHHHDMVGADGDTATTPVVKELFWSLLGAVAFALLTQHWVAVYVVSLQRKTQAPQYIHVRRLNALVRILQRTPATIWYRRMVCSKVLEVHADSGFSKEQDAGYGIRGANFLRKGTDRSGKTVWHLLDSPCRSHKHVTRCSFSSETRAVCAAADEIKPLLLTLEEITYGPHTAADGRHKMDHGGFTFQSILVTDSMSLWAAVSALNIKVPQEKGLAVHLFWLRELLDHGLLNVLRWTDTRDMTADCHTKGSIDRKAILALMNGEFAYQHPFKDFTPHEAKQAKQART